MGKQKDWTGNNKTTYVTLGASNHSEGDREAHDYYATDPRALELLLDLETFSDNVYEICCGQGHLAEVLVKRGYNVKATDLVDRGYGVGGVDFFKVTDKFDGDIITNPPYKFAVEMVDKSLSIIPDGNRVAMFLKIQFLESSGRYKFFKENPPKIVYVSSKRMQCALNGEFDKHGAFALCYCWFIWEKGYKGSPIIKWFNTDEDNDKYTEKQKTKAYEIKYKQEEIGIDDLF
jgi:SAM-dependent methyltransferase